MLATAEQPLRDFLRQAQKGQGPALQFWSREGLHLQLTTAG